MAKKNYEQKTEKLILPVLEELGLKLYDIDYVKEGPDYYLRVYIDKEGGVDINDCVNVSRIFNEILDREDYIADPYTFEVSSPGLTRQLKKKKEYALNIGKRVAVSTYQKIEGEKAFSGTLLSCTDARILLLPDGEEDVQRALELDMKDIASAHLNPELDF